MAPSHDPTSALHLPKDATNVIVGFLSGEEKKAARLACKQLRASVDEGVTSLRSFWDQHLVTESLHAAARHWPNVTTLRLQLADGTSKSVIQGIATHFQHLTRLDLCWRGQDNPRSLPASLGQLAKLERLELRSCRRLTALPESLGQLAALQHLDLSWCISLAALPESLGQLAALQHLDLRLCQPEVEHSSVEAELLSRNVLVFRDGA